MWTQTSDEYLMERLHKDAYNRMFQEAEKVRLLRKAGLIKPVPFLRLACWGTSCLGRVLVALGRRLEQAAAAG